MWTSHIDFKNKFSLPHDVLNNKIQKKIKIFKVTTLLICPGVSILKYSWSPKNDTFGETYSGP